MGRPRQFVESDVIASAGAAFTSTGYSGTTLDDLVVATGLGKQSLYNAFGGKRELFLRALTSETGEAVASLTQALTDEDVSPLERIKAQLLKLAVEFSDSGETGTLFTKATVELAERDGDVARSAMQAFTDLAAVYRHCIVDAQEHGEVDAQADASALANYFVAVTRGMEVLGNAGADRATLTAIALTSLVAMR
ncbi:TetR/AcrR family transcriptional regulator [Curtobacterium sp. ISL-83]|uniref:TetR/AcrR family transcriptional regulator n=1 Tax=Curtobacterium sp. ISL-83 TaxID=2819145 RepID=UPI001BEADD84|nr:TetR/AcrR family transcriptional regulator [Curtobacterium sp. ISL-83]MBT2502850.1 TetR/AcrR family transcriptional regulator [Curtobacterium sp. ISL-83]